MMDMLTIFLFRVLPTLLIGIAITLIYNLFKSKQKHSIFAYLLPLILIVISVGLYTYYERPKISHFEKLTNETFTVDKDMSYYKGFPATFADIGSDRDVIRELHYQLFAQILETKNSQKNSYLLIIAPPQEGKRALLLRFAKELVDNKEIVLWADATYKFAQENPFDELQLIRRWRKKRIFAIVDNIARLLRYEEFLQDLARHPEIKVTIIGASRYEDWENVKFKHPPGIEYIFENPDSKPLLPYQLKTTDSDIKSAVNKLREKGSLKREKVGRKPPNFSILIWALAAPEGEENFSQKILDEAEKLPIKEKKAYCYICALDRFGIPMPASFIQSLLGKDIIVNLQSLIRKEIIRHIAKEESYISKHEVVAETIFKYYSSQLANLKPIEVYKKLLQKATLKEGQLIAGLFIYLERELTDSLKINIIEKYNKTFHKSKSPELLGLGWGPLFDKICIYDLAERAYQRAISINDNIPDAHNNYAILLYKIKKYTESENQFKRALELKEDLPNTHSNYATFLFIMKRYFKAEMHFKRALELNEDDCSVHNNYAFLLYKMKKYTESENHFKRALELKEDDAYAHTNYAILLYDLERYQEAEQQFKRALKLKEDLPEVNENYAIMLTKQKRYQEAEDHYKRALELKEDYPETHYNYATLLVMLERYMDAEEHYKRALELKENYPEAHHNYAKLLVKLKIYDKADKHYRRARELKEDYPEAHYNYAVLLTELKRYKEAEEHYKRALDLNEYYPEAHNNYGVLLILMNKYPEAEEHFKRALELKEDDPEAHNNYANLLTQMQRYEEANTHYKIALELKEDFVGAHNNYAFMLINLESYQEAEEHLKRSLDLKDDDPETHSNYAILLSILKKYQKAEEHFNRAFQLKEDDPLSHYNYANMLFILERYSEAEWHYKRTLELKQDYAVAMVNLGFLYLKEGFRYPEKANYWLKKAWEYREKLPDKGESVKEALKSLSSEKGKKDEKSPENEL